MKNPKITIITVCYNAVDTIEKTILSVINQSYCNIEYIIIDGASTDGTIDIIKKYKDHVTKWLSEPDNGIYDAMNKGAKMASGEWVNYMNSGDSFASHNVLQDIFSKEYDSRIGVIYGDANMLQNNKIIFLYKSFPFWESKQPYRTGKGICHQSMFVKTKLLIEFPFDDEFKICADFKQAYDIHKNGYNFFDTKTVISLFDINGTSHTNALSSLRENARIVGMEKTIKYRLFLYYVILRKIINKTMRNF